jgi:FdhD protein
MKPVIQRPVWRNGACRPDDLAEEVPIAFEYNGISHAVMLATPADLDDFAVGFSLSEGIVARRKDIFDLVIAESEAGVTLQMEIATEDFTRLKQRRRSLAGRTGCGLCGAESLGQVMRELAPLPPQESFPLAALHAGMCKLPARQLLQQATGATHAACRVSRTGAISHVREDVGRHNALDKTLGALASEGVVAGDGALVITSRASFEMVQKAAALGFATLAAVSAPTARAVRLAREPEHDPDRVPASGGLRGLCEKRDPAGALRMNPDHLIRMANQIGAFFEAMPDREQAVKDVADHLRRTWDPRMRTDSFWPCWAGADEDRSSSLMVRDAVLALRQADTA